MIDEQDDDKDKLDLLAKKEGRRRTRERFENGYELISKWAYQYEQVHHGQLSMVNSTFLQPDLFMDVLHPSSMNSPSF